MSHDRRTLVTGASGFIGSAVVRALLHSGFDVRAFVRKTSPRANLSGLPIEYAEGDLLDSDTLALALKDVRYVIHVAADYRLWARNASRLMAANVEGTRNVMAEALKSGVDKVVYTSSVCTLAKDASRDAADETHSLELRDAYNPYKRSKLLAEKLVLDFAADKGLNVVIVNPSAPIGPRDIKPTPTGRIILECASGRVPAYVDTGLNLVHVDDVAKGHVAALMSGVVGERYILGGENVRLRAMLAEIARQASRRPPRVKLSPGVVYPFALASEGLAWITGKEPFATRDGLRMAKDIMFFDDTKARNTLGYSSRPYQDAITDAIAWFRRAGMLPETSYTPSRRYHFLSR